MTDETQAAKAAVEKMMAEGFELVVVQDGGEPQYAIVSKTPPEALAMMISACQEFDRQAERLNLPITANVFLTHHTEGLKHAQPGDVPLDVQMDKRRLN